MMKIRSILTGIAISLSLAGMAQSQYDGAPVNRSANETSTDNVEVRKNKYPRSDNDWENFNVLHINRLPSAANFMGYPTKELALQGDKSQSPYFQSLNGTWKFHFVPRSDERPMDFFQKDMMFQVGMILKFLPIGSFKGSAILLCRQWVWYKEESTIDCSGKQPGWLL